MISKVSPIGIGYIFIIVFLTAQVITHGSVEPVWKSDSNEAVGLSAGRQLSESSKIWSSGAQLETELNVVADSLYFNSNGGSKQFDILSNVSWEISADANWISVGPTKGTDDETVTITIPHNSTGNARSAAIIITGGGKVEEVTIVQEAFQLPDLPPASPSDPPPDSPPEGPPQPPEEAVLDVSPNPLEVGYAGGMVELNIKANDAWVIVDYESWIRLEKNNGYFSGPIMVELNANMLSTSRTGRIKLSGGGEVIEVSVIQEGKKSTDPPVGLPPETQPPGTPPPPPEWPPEEPPQPWEPEPLEATPNPLEVGYAGGHVNLSINADDAWVIIDYESWISLDKNNGYNSGSVTVELTANDDSTSRTGRIKLFGGGETVEVTVVQAGKESEGPPVDLPPGTPPPDTPPAPPQVILDAVQDYLEFSPIGESKEIGIHSNVGWRLKTEESWIVLSPDSGIHDGSVMVTLAANDSSNSRSGRIILSGAGKTDEILIYQEGASIPGTPADITLDLSTNSLEFSHVSNSKIVVVTSNADWEVGGYPDWITVNPANGSRNGFIMVSVTPHGDTDSRSSQIVISSGDKTRKVVVNQDGLPLPDMLLASTSGPVLFDYSGSAQQVTVDSNIDWHAETDSNWISCHPSTGSGSGVITITVSRNELSESRSGTITLSGGEFVRVINVSQVSKSISVNPLQTNLTFCGGEYWISISSNGDWSVEELPDWITVNSMNGSGNGAILARVDYNSSAPRTAEFTIGGVSHIIRQGSVHEPLADNYVVSNRNYIWKLFWELLGRDPMPEELDLYTSALEQGVTEKRGLTAELMVSAEAQNGLGAVIRLFIACFGRYPDYNDLMSYHDLSCKGRVSQADLSIAFSESSEFKARYNNLSDGEFVIQIFQNASGLPPDGESLAYFVSQLSAGSSRGSMVLELSHIITMGDYFQNRTLIAMAYAILLGEAPGEMAEDWLWYLENNGLVQNMVDELMKEDSFGERYSSDIPSHAEEAVRNLYSSILDHDPDNGLVDTYAGWIENDTYTPWELAFSLIDSPEAQDGRGALIRLYYAVFLMPPDYEGLMFWDALRKSGNDLKFVAEAFFKCVNRYDTMNDSEFVSQVYRDVLLREPDSGGLEFWTKLLGEGAITRSNMLLEFSESDEFRTRRWVEVFLVYAYSSLLEWIPAPNEEAYVQGILKVDAGGAHAMLKQLIEER